MKKLIVVLALLISVQSVSMAQETYNRKGDHRSMTPEQKAEKQTARMQQALQLTADQNKAIYDMNLQSAKEMKAAKTEAREANKEKFKAMHERRDARLKSILSAEQFSKYQTMQAERKNKMKQKRSENKGLRQG